jgi:putative ABC transport system ATP-binding protein
MTTTIDRNAAVASSRVTKHFGEGDNRVEVLRGVDLTVPFGEMTMLVGPSGCGKTTMLSVIAGLLNRSGGELNVLGRDLSELSGAEAVQFRRKNLGFVFQQYNLLPSLTAAENAAVPLLAAGVKKKQAVDRAADLLDDLGLGSRTRAFPNQLSGGQQQRVAMARALVHDPRLVVCDEPTSALDHETGQVVMDLLSRIAVRPGRAVVVVTHDSRVFDFADRIAHMDDGRIETVSDQRSAVSLKQSRDRQGAVA